MKGYFYYEQNELVGYCLMCKGDRYYVMEYLEVSPDQQKKGVGSFIYSRMKQLYAEFILEPVFGSYHFYLSRGARPVASHSGGILLFVSQRAPTVVRNELFPDFGSYEPQDDFVYVREEWSFYDETK